MPDLEVTASFIENLTKGIKSKYGNSSHTEVMELVATSMGMKPSSLIRAMKKPDGKKTGRAIKMPSTLQSQTYDIDVDRIENARSLEKLSVFSEAELKALTDFGNRENGLLLVTGVERLGWINVVASLANTWREQLGKPSDITRNLADHGRDCFPGLDSLGFPPTLDHVVATLGPDGPKIRFALANVSGPPNNMARVIRSSNLMPTVAAIEAPLVALLRGHGERASAYWAGKEREHQVIYKGLVENVGLVVETRMPASCFLSAKVLTFEDWVSS